MSQVKRFGIWQTSKFMGILYLVVSIVMVLPISGLLGVFGLLGQSEMSGSLAIGIAILIPLVHGGLAFIMTIIGCLIYNMVAAMVGGIEVELSDDSRFRRGEDA